MHITKSLIKSTSNCRHWNQSQLPIRHHLDSWSGSVYGYHIRSSV